MVTFDEVYISITEVIDKHIKILDNPNEPMSDAELNRRIEHIGELNTHLEQYDKILREYRNRQALGH